MSLFNNKPRDNGVQKTIYGIKSMDNAIASESCCDCGNGFGRKELTYYKGYRCKKCLLKFMESEYDTSPNDATARYLIKCGSKSIWWQHATAEQKQYALDYYKLYGKPKEDTIKEQIEEILG